MGILRRLREWREDANGILTGPAIDTDTLDANSVNTDDATITNSLDASLTGSQDPTAPTKWLSHDGIKTQTQNEVSTQITADNTAQSVYEYESAPEGGLLIVTGYISDAALENFTDLIIVAGVTSFTVFQSTSRGTPAARSYSINFPNLQVSIDDGSETYNIAVQSVVSR